MVTAMVTRSATLLLLNTTPYHLRLSPPSPHRRQLRQLRRLAYCNQHGNSQSHNNSNQSRDTKRNAYGYLNLARHCFAHCDLKSNAYAGQYSHAKCNANADGRPKYHPHFDSDSKPNAITDGRPKCRPYFDGDRHTNTLGHANKSHSYCHTNSLFTRSYHVPPSGCRIATTGD